MRFSFHTMEPFIISIASNFVVEELAKKAGTKVLNYVSEAVITLLQSDLSGEYWEDAMDYDKTNNRYIEVQKIKEQSSTYFFSGLASYTYGNFSKETRNLIGIFTLLPTKDYLIGEGKYYWSNQQPSSEDDNKKFMEAGVLICRFIDENRVEFTFHDIYEINSLRPKNKYKAVFDKRRNVPGTANP